MPKLPTISDAEWEVMTTLWDRSPLLASDVVEKLQFRKRWKPRTIKTLLNRLLKKGAIGFTTQANRYLYSPRINRDTCVRRESQSFLRRVFKDANGPMLVQFVRQMDLSPEEIKQLKAVLNEKSASNERRDKPRS